MRNCQNCGDKESPERKIHYTSLKILLCESCLLNAQQPTNSNAIIPVLEKNPAKDGIF